METLKMGRVITEAKFENFGDVWNVKTGLLTADQIRTVVVTDALVDTGATLLSLPTRLIQQLGLIETSTKKVNSSRGVVEAKLYGAVRLTIQGRDCIMDVLEVPDTTPVLIGQLPLGHLDFVVDPREQKLIGNPRHNGEHIYDLF